MIDQERPNNLFEPDVTIGVDPSVPQSGERDLLLAVLEDAMRCYLNNLDATDRKKRALHEDAAEWFAATEDEGLCSFVNVCAVLGFDPDFVRRRLRAGRKKVA
jgi:hypothetical protein